MFQTNIPHSLPAERIEFLSERREREWRERKRESEKEEGVLSVEGGKAYGYCNIVVAVW